jgi:hypothetical protein
MNFRRELMGLLLFGVAFGYVEAAVVVYMRAISEPLRQRVLTGPPHDEVFPLLRIDDWEQAGQKTVIVTEFAREFATMVMLAAVAMIGARSVRHWFAAFMIAFGTWDIFYYVFLRLLIGWPASLWTWDILFFLPVAWVGPVIAPVLVAAGMILAGSLMLWKESIGQPMPLSRLHWSLILGGGLVVIVAFCWDFRNVAAGGLPKTFNWPLFALGNLIGLAGFVHSLRRRPTPHAVLTLLER